jgi:hypothetical protein
MTLEKAYEPLKDQVEFGGFYNRNAARLILAEVSREHGQAAVDRLIRDLDRTPASAFYLAPSSADPEAPAAELRRDPKTERPAAAGRSLSSQATGHVTPINPVRVRSPG